MWLLGFVIDDQGTFGRVAPVVWSWVALRNLQAVDIGINGPALFYRLDDKADAVKRFAATRDSGDYRDHERTPKKISTDLMAARVNTALPIIDIA